MWQKHDFKIPFSFAQRKPLLQDAFLFIPGFYETKGKHGPKLDLVKIFKNSRPVQIEYCSGNGSWIAEKAKKNPHLNWLAVEKDFIRARKIWLKIKRNNLPNLFLILGEALVFTSYYLKNNSLANVFVNFPDPWPKRRHHKKRLVNVDFVQILKKKMKKEAKITLATDHEELVFFMIDAILKNKFEPVFEKPYFKESFVDYGTSYFEDLFRGKGKKIRYMQFQK